MEVAEVPIEPVAKEDPTNLEKWVIGKLYRLKIKDEYRHKIELEDKYASANSDRKIVSRRAILPPVNTPEIIEITQKVGQVLHESSKDIWERDDDRDLTDEEMDQRSKLEDERWNQSKELRALLLGLVNCYSDLSQIPRVNNVVVGAPPGDTQDSEFHYFMGMYSYSDRTIYLNPRALEASHYLKRGAAWTDTVIHEWVHHFIECYESGGELDKSPFVDKRQHHTENFVKLEKALGIDTDYTDE